MSDQAGQGDVIVDTISAQIQVDIFFLAMGFESEVLQWSASPQDGRWVVQVIDPEYALLAVNRDGTIEDLSGTFGKENCTYSSEGTALQIA